MFNTLGIKDGVSPLRFKMKRTEANDPDWFYAKQWRTGNKGEMHKKYVENKDCLDKAKMQGLETRWPLVESTCRSY